MYAGALPSELGQRKQEVGLLLHSAKAAPRAAFRLP
jgi:hypothetical protein